MAARRRAGPVMQEQQKPETGAYEHPFLGSKAGEGGPIVPLVLSMECTATETEMNANVAATLARGYTSLIPYLMTVSGCVSLCGAGPSLGANLGEVRKRDVFAVNSAHGYLLEQDIVPRWTMIWDCAELCEKFAVPHPDTTFLIGSRCHPKVFERLKDCKVVVWHACGDHNILEYLEEKNVMEPLVNGGTTGITRGIYLAYALGYRDFHLFGADSSYKEGVSHVKGSLVHEHRIPIMVNGHWFDSTPQWAAQIEEMKIMYPMFRNQGQAEMTAYDDGMLSWVMSIMKSDEHKALANALATIELQVKQRGEAAPGVPGCLPVGTIQQIHEQAPHLVAGAMKTLQPLGETQ